MNLFRATWIMDYLSRRRMTGMIAADLDDPSGVPDYLVMLNLTKMPKVEINGQIMPAPVDLSELGVHCWLMGFSAVLQEGVITFKTGPAMLPETTADVEAEVSEEIEQEPWESPEAEARWLRQQQAVADELIRRKQEEAYRQAGFQGQYGNPMAPPTMWTPYNRGG